MRDKKQVTQDIYVTGEIDLVAHSGTLSLSLSLVQLNFAKWLNKQTFPANGHAKLFSVTVVKGAAGEILDSWAPNGSEQQFQQLPQHTESGDVA